MCEIQFISKDDELNAREYDQIHALLLYGASGNADGYGITDGSTIIKDGRKYEEKHRKVINQLEAKSRSTFLIAHNRFKTQGAATKDNAHPFSTKHLIYAHNGIIHNANDRAKEENTTLAVDSQIIGVLTEKHLTQKLAIEDALKKTIENLTGSFSIFVYYKPQKRLFYVKHEANFYFKVFEDKKTRILTGSTDENNLLSIYNDLKTQSKSGLYLKKYVIKEELTPEENTLYEIKGTEIKTIFESIKISESMKEFYFKYDDDAFKQYEKEAREYFKPHAYTEELPKLEDGLNTFFCDSAFLTQHADGRVIVSGSEILKEELRAYEIDPDDTSAEELNRLLFYVSGADEY